MFYCTPSSQDHIHSPVFTDIIDKMGQSVYKSRNFHKQHSEMKDSEVVLRSVYPDGDV